MSETAIGTGRNAKNGQFIKGYEGGPGRKAGSRSKLSTLFLDDLKSTWERHGADVLERLARDDPAALLRTVAMLMPKDVNINMSLDVGEFANNFRSALALLGNEPALPKPRKPMRVISAD